MTPSPLTPLVTVSEQWKAAYSGAAAGFLLLRDVANPPQTNALEAQKAALEQGLQTRFAGFDRARLREVFPLPAYTAYYRRFQQTYHVLLQLESVVRKGKPLPRGAALVEAMFLAELKNLLLTAGHDAATLSFPIRLDVASGRESYTLLGGKGKTLTPGDMFMADGRGIISAILFGPDQRSRITPETTTVLFAVYAPAGIGYAAVNKHLQDLAANVQLVTPQASIEQQKVIEA